jgi:hypothetical protein
LVGLLNGGGFTGATGEQPLVYVPSAKMGRSGYDPQDFEDKSPNGLPRSFLFQDRGRLDDSKGQSVVGVPFFSSQGIRGSTLLVLLVGSQESGRADSGMCSLVMRIINLKRLQFC